MPEETPVPNDSPLMIAWNAYKASPEFTNTRYWALRPDHTNGSLWAAFVAGWEAAQHGVQPTADHGQSGSNRADDQQVGRGG